MTSKRRALKFINDKISEQLVGHYMYIDPQDEDKEYHYRLSSELTKNDRIFIKVQVNEDHQVNLCSIQYNSELKKFTIKVGLFDEFDEDSVILLLNVLRTAKSAIDSYRLSNPTSQKVTVE